MQQTFSRIQQQLEAKDLKTIAHDFKRPWGGFFVIDPLEATKFIELYFPKEQWSTLYSTEYISPKILMVAPHKRLSWQYHNRRSEVWTVLEGPVGVIQSLNDLQGEVTEYNAGDTIVLKQGERHRLVGLSTTAIIAEIWQHTDINNPSNEEDIVRLEDDFGR